MTVKWGVIGAGGIADRRTIPEGILSAKNASLVAVMDIDRKKAAEVAQKYGGVKRYFREKDLLSDPDIDAVYIATATYLHKEQTCMAAIAGKHVLCEKPMAMTLIECEEMIDACRKNRVKLMLGYMMRFHAIRQVIKRMVDDGKLGKIVLARAQLSCWYPPIAGAWRQKLELGGGGSLIDMGTHCIDLLEMFVGKASKINCFVANAVHAYESEDSAIALLEFENGAHGVVDSYFNIPCESSENRLEIYGTRGSIMASGTIGQASDGEAIARPESIVEDYDALQTGIDASGGVLLKPELVNIYQAEIEHFSECIEKDRTPWITGEAGMRNLKLVLAGYESARCGKAMPL
ncbi:Gfo/Idh/MocA family oxidoreductase [candidate division KSB1 bacterium]|nr:Gfo/Idh/MocA family oxidoreductase [candidate division KSB1 bacterium]